MRRKRTMAFAMLLLVLLVLLVPFLFAGDADVPVRTASAADWNPQSFWYEPWGVSGVHKGIDIFAPEGGPVLSAVPLPWRATRQSQGWRRMFYLDPGQVLSDRGAP